MFSQASVSHSIHRRGGGCAWSHVPLGRGGMLGGGYVQGMVCLDGGYVQGVVGRSGEVGNTNLIITRMHSSRMRTTCYSSCLLGGVCLSACWDTPPAWTPQTWMPLKPPTPRSGAWTSSWVWVWTSPGPGHPHRYGPGHPPPQGVGLDTPPPARPPNLPPGSGPRHPPTRPPNLPRGPGPRHPPPL